METRNFGAAGPAVSVLGQGTWKISDSREVRETLAYGLDLGMCHVDTAELYTGAEAVVGAALKGRRAEAFLVSKVLPRHASAGGVVAACDRSLRALKTDYLDAYLLHWNAGEVPIAETMGAMLRLREAGKIRAIGVSNFEVWELEEAQAALGDVPLACNQVLYHLGAREAEGEVWSWCRENGTALVGYSPFGDGAAFAEGGAAYAALAEVGARHDKTARQVALRFLTRLAGTFAIPKASTRVHVAENAAASGFELSEVDVACLESALGG